MYMYVAAGTVFYMFAAGASTRMTKVQGKCHAKTT